MEMDFIDSEPVFAEEILKEGNKRSQVVLEGLPDNSFIHPEILVR